MCLITSTVILIFRSTIEEILKENEKTHVEYFLRKLFKLDEPDMQDTAGEAEMNS